MKMSVEEGNAMKDIKVVRVIEELPTLDIFRVHTGEKPYPYVMSTVRTSPDAPLFSIIPSIPIQERKHIDVVYAVRIL